MSHSCASVEASAPLQDRDPVCGASLSIHNDTPRTAYLGRTYFFRTPQCRERFEAEPGRYVAELARRQFRIWLWS